MQLNAAQVDNPGQTGSIVYNNLLRRSSRGEGQGDGSQPRGTVGGSALLIERLSFRAIYKALQYDRPVSNARQRARRDGQVILHDVQLGKLRLLREIEFVRVSHSDLMPVNRKNFGGAFLLHANKATPERAATEAAPRLERDIQARDNAAFRSDRITGKEAAKVQNIQAVVQIVSIHLESRIDLLAAVDIDTE